MVEGEIDKGKGAVGEHQFHWKDQIKTQKEAIRSIWFRQKTESFGKRLSSTLIEGSSPNFRFSSMDLRKRSIIAGGEMSIIVYKL